MMIAVYACVGFCNVVLNRDFETHDWIWIVADPETLHNFAGAVMVSAVCNNFLPEEENGGQGKYMREKLTWTIVVCSGSYG